MNLIFATSNRGKLLEAQTLAKQNLIALDSPQLLVDQLGQPPVVIEDQQTYLGNAQKKAEAYFAWCRRAVVADDSGLEVKSLAGQPGVLTARFAGENASDAQNRAHLLKLLDKSRNRDAVIRCVLYARIDSQHFLALDDSIEIQIATQERGAGGFGYDPLLLIPQLGLTLAEIKERKLDFPTHRVGAFRKMFALLNQLLKLDDSARPIS